ncbi:MAG: exosortase-associated EpsI family protein [Planctomycetota bacterium]
MTASQSVRKTRRNGSALLAMVLVGATLIAGSVGFYVTLEVRGVRLNKLPIYAEGGRTLTNALPRETDSWVQAGTDRIESAEVEDVLGTRNYVTRRYRSRDVGESGTPAVLELHAAYYTGQIDTVPHVPERCFVAGGLRRAATVGEVRLPLDTGAWSVDVDVDEEFGEVLRARTSDGSRLVRLPRQAESLAMRVSTFATDDGSNPLFAGYFFIANGGWTASAENVRLLAFKLEYDYSYYMKVQITSSSFESKEDFVAASGQLMDEVIGDLMLCVPDWIEVQRGTYPPADDDTTS